MIIEHNWDVSYEKSTYRVLVKEPERKRSLARHKRKWVNNIKMNLHEIKWDVLAWNNLAQDRDRWRDAVDSVLNFTFH